jgi:hypothetical protein
LIRAASLRCLAANMTSEIAIRAKVDGSGMAANARSAINR